jgi:hypothetical protein
MKPNRDPQDPLAAWADQTLKQLPVRRAPATLMPRVLAALARQRALPWYQQPWFHWPRHFQMLAFVLATALVAGLAWLIIPHGDAVTLSAAKNAALQSELVRPVAATVTTTADIFGTLGHAATLVLKTLPTWTWAAVAGGAAIIWCSTLGLGTAAWRLASPQR